MKLKGLVWFFAIVLLIISLWQLSYTWVVKKYESDVEAKAQKQVKVANPNLSGDAYEDAVSRLTQHVLDSTRDKPIYPGLGTTYEKSKMYELNLGLDLQGGMGVTMDVDLETLLKSLSNNPNDPAFIKAMNTAKAENQSKDGNLIDLFTKAYKSQNGSGKLAAVFSGADKDIRVTDSDEKVEQMLREVGNNSINETYQVLQRRIDKFGLSSPSINKDDKKSVINVELAGVKDPQRVRKMLQTSANLQFWEVYNLEDAGIGDGLVKADNNLQDYLNGVTPEQAAASTDSTLKNKNKNPLFTILQVMQPQKGQNGQPYYYPNIGYVALKDTGLLNKYIHSEIVKAAFPANALFMYGSEEKNTKGTEHFFPVYIIKTQHGTNKAPMEGDAVEKAEQSYTENGKPSVKMQLTSAGTKTWARLTTKNAPSNGRSGRPIAIVLDSLVYSAPTINEPITSGSSEISGSFSVEEAKDLASILESGRLDAPAKIVAEQLVGPSLGSEAVKGGTMAFVISFIVIFLLMLIYYNTSGWVANVALILNLLYTVGVLAMFGLVLTAAGIAGLVLTIGMAVDTNVIIFERIKEELLKGKSNRDAVETGYKKSLAPVIDAHVTSLLTAVILLIFGIGPVLGFATTQIIGLLLSLFCGILLSRVITEFLMNKGVYLKYFTKISKKVLQHPQYDFIGKRKYAYILSIIVIILGISSFFVGFHEGVEFKGGRSYTVRFDKEINSENVRNDLKTVFEDNPIVKNVNNKEQLNITTSFLRNVPNSDSVVLQKLYEGLQKELPQGTSYAQFVKKNLIGVSSVQPTISQALKSGAVKATIIAILIIFLYIFMRFRDWRYSLGTIVTLVHDVMVTLAVFAYLKDVVPFPLEIDQHFIAAVLTVIGFSMNDTVIVFDRVREYARDMFGASKETIVNKAINDTLSRTIMTSLTVFLTVLILFIFGGEATRGFAFAMLIGVVTGTYSSIFVGAPILVDVDKSKPLGAAPDKRHKEKAPPL